MHARRGSTDRMEISLFWRICLTNAVVFAAGITVLAASPATVSSPISRSEVLTLLVGLGLLVVANAVLVRGLIAPFDRLRDSMEDVDLLRPGQRLPEHGNGPAGDVIRGFNAMLARLEVERASSTRRALAAQEGERRRVAQELHDGVGQGLTAVLLTLRRVADQAPAALAPDIELAQEAARSSLDEVRHVARRLRPGVLDDLGLRSAVASLAGEHARITGGQVRRCLSSTLPPLDPEAELVIFRVAQEALTNVARHAAATETLVELSPVDGGGAVLLRIADDGRGMDGGGEGAGVRGMRERALLVGATLDISAGDPGGTDVRLVVPAGRGGRS